MTADLYVPEDELYDSLWETITSFFDPDVHTSIYKGYPNLSSSPYPSYIVLSPGVKERSDQLIRHYDGVSQVLTRGTIYSYQVDCYGPKAPDYADVVSMAWRSMWTCDRAAVRNLFTPLYASEPQQLNIVNGEDRFEQRYTSRLFAFVNQTVALPQAFITEVPEVRLAAPDIGASLLDFDKTTG